MRHSGKWLTMAALVLDGAFPMLRTPDPRIGHMPQQELAGQSAADAARFVFAPGV